MPQPPKLLDMVTLFLSTNVPVNPDKSHLRVPPFIVIVPEPAILGVVLFGVFIELIVIAPFTVKTVFLPLLSAFRQAVV